MSVLDKYIYKNCFELNNKNNDINNYLFDASFNNQPISDENDCAEYAYYNNHPSFFFQKNNTNQQAKCYVFKYNHNNTNQIDKKTQINTIINLNYDMNNNTNLPKYNLKELTNEDDESFTNTQCTNHNNAFNFFMMKSFSNSYNLNSENIHNRDIKYPVANNILSEYYDFLSKNDNDNDNINKFHTNFVKLQPLFKNLYHKNINDNSHNMYYDMISNYINNTIYFVSEFGIGISKHTNTNDNLILSSIHSEEEPTKLNSYKYLNFNNNDINYFNNNGDSTNPIIRAHPFFLGVPLYILREHFYYIRNGGIDLQTYDNFYTMFYKPKDYFEDYYYDFINATFISFILDKIQKTTLTNFEIFYNNYNNSSTFSNLEQSDKDYLNNPIFHVESNTNYSFTLLDFLYCYGWCYDDIETTSFSDDVKNSLQDVMRKLYDGSSWYNNVDYARRILGKILLNLLVYKRKPNNLEVQKGMQQFAGVDNSDYNKTDKIIQAIKMKLYPDIIEKFLSTSYDYDTFSENFKNTIEPYNLISRQHRANMSIVSDTKKNYTNKLNYINIFKKIYTNQFRLNIIDNYFKTRIKVLEYENNSIKADVNNIKTYIDNIYLHSKLNNIENYIYNEKSKLKYLFNKNSSEKQKNDDLKFLNTFILTENIVICIIIFILILFFIKK